MSKEENRVHNRIHNKFLDGVRVRKITPEDTFEESGETIIFASNKSKRSLIRLTHTCIERAARDLGEAPPFPPSWKCYFLVRSSIIIGFSLIENNIESYIEDQPNDKVICPIGILRFWVVEKYRRQGLATILIDAARHHEEEVIPKTMVAFSEPTEDGMNFATHYCGTSPYIYEIVLY